MEFFGDFHCHTKYSDGRNTVEEMLEAAKIKGLKKLAITDHGPNNIGTGVKNPETYLEIREDIQVGLARLATEEKANMSGTLEVLLGAEADVIDLDGKIDIPREVLKELDWLIIGLHPYIKPASLDAFANLLVGNQVAKVSRWVKDRLKDCNTKALVESLYKYTPDCVSHPDLQMGVDLEEVTRACVENDTLYEINTGHQFQQVEDVRQAAKQGVNFIVNSDSHYSETLGELAWGGELLAKAGVAEEQIYNCIDRE